MKNRVLTDAVPKSIGQEVVIYGWIERIRSHGKIAFFEIRDRGGILQVVASNSETVGSLENVSIQSVIKISGIC